MTKRLLTLALLLLPVAAHSQTINAASCNQADVQAALSAATASTTTINIPACPSGVSYSSGLTFVQPAGSTNLTIKGAGTSAVGGGDQTVIIDNITRNASTCNPDPALLDITTGPATSACTAPVRTSASTTITCSRRRTACSCAIQAGSTA